jgi:site-specific recombinase XerD
MTHQEAIEKMGKDFRLRGLSESTFRNYTRNVKKFLNFCNRPIEELDGDDVRRFLEHLIVEKKLKPRSVNQHSSSIRFFFAVGLNKTMNYNQIPMMKIPKILPEILTREEVSRIIGICTNAKHKALLLIAYGSSLRTGEIESLRVRDIDSKQMRIFVKGGKNKCDRYAVLSQSTLIALREYWKIFRPNSPDGWLFPGMRNIGHITRAAISLAFIGSCEKTGINKEVSVHSLRRAFATHMLEDGVDIYKIKELLGHTRIQSTMAYLRLLDTTKDVISPADKMLLSHD